MAQKVKTLPRESQAGSDACRVLRKHCRALSQDQQLLSSKGRCPRRGNPTSPSLSLLSQLRVNCKPPKLKARSSQGSWHGPGVQESPPLSLDLLTCRGPPARSLHYRPQPSPDPSLVGTPGLCSLLHIPARVLFLWDPRSSPVSLSGSNSPAPICPPLPALGSHPPPS